MTFYSGYIIIKKVFRDSGIQNPDAPEGDRMEDYYGYFNKIQGHYER